MVKVMVLVEVVVVDISKVLFFRVMDSIFFFNKVMVSCFFNIISKVMVSFFFSMVDISKVGISREDISKEVISSSMVDISCFSSNNIINFFSIFFCCILIFMVI